MRSQTRADPSKTRRRQIVNFANSSTSETLQTRVLREASLIRRLLRGTHVDGTGVVGEAATVDALERGAVDELLLTPRCAELLPAVSLKAMQLAAARGVRTTKVTGLAAFELDLAADGIGAILRRSPCGSRPTHPHGQR